MDDLTLKNINFLNFASNPRETVRGLDLRGTEGLIFRDNSAAITLQLAESTAAYGIYICTRNLQLTESAAAYEIYIRVRKLLTLSVYFKIYEFFHPTRFSSYTTENSLLRMK